MLRGATLVLCSLLMWNGCRSDPKPGIKLRLTSKGIEQMLSVAEAAVNQKLTTSKLPGVRLEMNLGPGKARLDIRKFLLADVQAPVYEYHPVPPSAVHWTAKDGSLTLKGAWSAFYTYLVKVSFDGYFIATAKNLSMSATIEVVRNEDGRAEVRVPTCKANVDSMQVNFVGGAIPKVLNALRGAMADALEGAVREKVCSLVQKVVVSKVNEKLRGKPPSLPINLPNSQGKILFNYNLVADPKVTENFIDVLVNGTFTSSVFSSAQYIAHIPESAQKENMVYLWVTEAVPQSFFNSTFEADVLKFELNRNTTPQFANSLRTTCPASECVGSRRKGLGEKFPNTSVTVDFWASAPPVIVFANQRVVLNAQIWANMYAEPKSEETLCMVLRFDIQAKLRPFFKNDKLSTKLTFETFSIQVNESRVGEVSAMESMIIADIASAQIQDKINRRFSSNPLNILPMNNLVAQNPSLDISNGVFRIQTDFKYVLPESPNDTTN